MIAIIWFTNVIQLAQQSIPKWIGLYPQGYDFKQMRENFNFFAFKSRYDSLIRRNQQLHWLVVLAVLQRVWQTHTWSDGCNFPSPWKVERNDACSRGCPPRLHSWKVRWHSPMGAFEAGLVVCLFFNWYLQCVFNRHELQPPLATHFGGWWRAIGKDFGESKQAKQGRQIWWIKKNRNKLFFLNELNFTNSGVQALRIDHDIVWYIHWSSWWTN
jgi:hypothetical protein